MTVESVFFRRIVGKGPLAEFRRVRGCVEREGGAVGEGEGLETFV